MPPFVRQRQRFLVAVARGGVVAFEPQRLPEAVQHHSDRPDVIHPSEDRERLLLALPRLLESPRDLVRHAEELQAEGLLAQAGFAHRQRDLQRALGQLALLVRGAESEVAVAHPHQRRNPLDSGFRRVPRLCRQLFGSLGARQ